MNLNTIGRLHLAVMYRMKAGSVPELIIAASLPRYRYSMYSMYSIYTADG